MEEKKKTGKARIVCPNNVNYTFIDDGTIYIQSESRPDENNNIDQKMLDVTKKSLKDLKMTKIHYKSNKSLVTTESLSRL